MASCLLSFLSLKNDSAYSSKLEKVADYIFIAGIGLLFITTILFSFDIIS